MEKMKAKISSIFVMLIIIMSLISCKSYAAYLSDSYISAEDIEIVDEGNRTKITHTGSNGSVHITPNTLYNNWWLFCSQRGQHIGSEAYYEWKETAIASPKAAYILNRADKNTGDYYSDIQQAWWTTEEGTESIGENEGDNNLSKEAVAYQDFVKEIAKNVDDKNTYKDMTHTYENGDTVTIKFPELDYDKLNSIISFNQGDEKQPTVSFNQETQKYMIGPFSINCQSSSYTSEAGETTEFGGISAFNIYTDASEEALSTDRWRFVWVDGQRAEGDSAQYPTANETFYIEMDYIENATKITNITAEYKYLIAGGQYSKLEGNYTTKGNVKKAQQLAFVDYAAQWYEIVRIGLVEDEELDKKGSIQIVKKAVDEYGNEMTAEQIRDRFGKDQYFDFKITITHENGRVETDHKQVKAGESAIAGPYTWYGEENAPTFKVEETSNYEGVWKVKSIEGANGSLADGKTSPCVVTAVNTIDIDPFEGALQITKTISGVAEKDETFKFKVLITEPNTEKTHEETAEIVVPAGKQTSEPWTSKTYWWYGDERPDYEIIEIPTEDSERYNASINPSKGQLMTKEEAANTDGKIKVNALNNEKESDDEKGYLTIQKELKEGQVSDKTFKFNIHVEGVKNTENGMMDIPVTIKAGEKFKTEALVWGKDDPAPTFEVTENVDNEYKVEDITATTDDGKSIGKKDGNKITGNLVADGNANVNVKFTNDITPHSGNIKVTKDIYTTEKISKETAEAEGLRFDIEVELKGTFVYNGRTYQNETEIIKKSLPENGNWSFEIRDIQWWGDEAPTFIVREMNSPSDEKTKGWHLRSTSYSDGVQNDTNSEGHKLIADQTVEATLVNELPSEKIIDLTFSMGGLVWVDDTLDQKNTAENGYYSSPNGVYDEGEMLKENAEVTVYKVIFDAAGNEVNRSVATAYKDIANNGVAFPIITGVDGKWSVPRISVPAFTDEEKQNGYTTENGYKASYDVVFGYDGQTYEPTEFLSYKIGSEGKTKLEDSNAERAQKYKDESTSERDKYARDSMAVLGNNANDTNRIAEVSGKTAIDANGNTTGIAKLTDGTEVEIQYTSDNAGTGYPTISKVKTTDENGRVLDLFRANASTLNGNLTFPFNKDGYIGSNLSNSDKEIDAILDSMSDSGFSMEGPYVDENGVHRKYKFTAVYNYCLHINLGLVERPAADISLAKNLDNAKVVVNEKMHEYKYSGAFDLTEEKQDTLVKDIYYKNSEDIQYTLGLYKADYYYRAEMYQTNQENNGLYDALETFYRSLDKNVTDTQMDVYLTYKIRLRNNSADYKVKVNSIDDYYDSSFALIKAQETKYLKTKTTKKDGEQEVNDTVVVANASDYADKWLDVKTGIAGSDKVTYNKMTAQGLEIMLEPNEEKDITVTFKLKKATDENGIKDSIVLGQKCNVAEIASYSTYFAGTENYAGKIDRDSAPSNVDISNKNEKAWYEDDTFAAPRLNVKLHDSERNVNGLAWEDNSKEGNGTEQPDDRYNQFVGDGVKQERDEKEIEGLTTKLVEKVMVKNADDTYTEYDYTWPTDVALDCLNGKTIESLTGFNSTVKTNSAGKYAFNGITAGDYVVEFTYGDEKVESKANYSEAQFYNGQDFKSTKLIKDTVKGGMASNFVEAGKYLDIDKLNASSEHRNTAVDSEVRRLQVVQNSREITYQNGEVLASSMKDDDLKAIGYTDTEMEGLRNELLSDKYSMFAQTPKLAMNVEFEKQVNDDNNTTYKYDVNNVDFGLEERPSTKLTLDKQIEEITLTTSDGNIIMNAKYNIDHQVDENGNIKAEVTLDNANSYGIDNLQALNRDNATNQGFRYINVDSTILEGTTITVKYRFTVLDTGEVDRTRKLNTNDWTNEKFASVCNELSAKLATYKKSGDSLVSSTNAFMGDYVGSIYYFGKDGDKADDVVTSTVRQMVDYIDNDASFSGMMNATANTSWSNVTAEELGKLIKPSIVENGTIVDSKGVKYETENRNNLVVSVDNADPNSELNNAGFVVELVPFNAVGKDESIRAGYQASMNLTVTRYVGADSGDLQIDNIAEIIRYNNTVGRRDEKTIPGNQKPAEALKTKDITKADGTVDSGMVYERDTSATEVITLSPPTGTGLTTWRLQVIASVTAGLVIVAGGIVLIKKKVLK